MGQEPKVNSQGKKIVREKYQSRYSMSWFVLLLVTMTKATIVEKEFPIYKISLIKSPISTKEFALSVLRSLMTFQHSFNFQHAYTSNEFM